MNISDILTPDLTAAIAQSVIALLGAVLTAVLAAGIRFIKVKTTAEQFAFLQNAAAIAVSAAEQLGLNGAIEDKKSVALAIASRELAARGIKVTAAQLDTAIEAAVLDAFNIGRATEESVDADITDGPDTSTTGFIHGLDFGRPY